MMFRRLLLLVVVAVINECLSKDAPPPSVTTKSGKIIGHYLTSHANNTYEAYQGIPYALPPIGERRFKSPIAHPSWSFELTANKLQSSCWQDVRGPRGTVKGNEDCLYLNVFVPHHRRKKANNNNYTMSLPVLFWIHGGGFHYGSSRPNEEYFLMDYNVILVTIQYRLGIFGFLSTQDEVVPGNMGLKDQSLALKWVNENIEYFGGDPKRITLFGHSAGGVSVHYHYLSPMSAGLFRNGISFSGTAFASWALSKRSREKAFELGRHMNCTLRNTEEMVECLRERSPDEIVKAQRKFMGWRMTPPTNFAPVVEKFSADPFIDRTPRQIIASGAAYDVPWITGVTSEEGLFPTMEWSKSEDLADINQNWTVRVAKNLLDFNYTIPAGKHERLAKIIKKYYFDDEDIDRSTFMKLVYLVGDRWFTVDSQNAAMAQARTNKSPVLFFLHSYQANGSMAAELSNSTEYKGVSHGDDVYLFLKNPLLNPRLSTRDMDMQRVLINNLVSFATNGYPNISANWPKVDANSAYLSYLYITGPEKENIKINFDNNLGERIFWNSIHFDEH